MKHTIIITDENGIKSTLIYQYLTAVAQSESTVVWMRSDSEKRCEFEFATEDEARAAYDKINEGLEEWLGRNDPVKLSTISHADYRYEVLDHDFSAHCKVYSPGDIIDYDPAQSDSWQYWLDSPAVIKRVPRDTT